MTYQWFCDSLIQSVQHTEELVSMFDWSGGLT